MAADLFVDSDGLRLAVRDHGGNGVPIVLVHGHLGNLAEYDDLGPRLARHMRVVAYDQRGQGWSESGPVGVESFAADLAAVVRALELERPVLLGSSFGALVCLAYALAGGSSRAFINQDGRASDFEATTASQPPPPGRTVVRYEHWSTYLDGFSSFGTVGELTARRASIRLGDGSYEVRPSQEQAFQKERAFGRLPVLDGYRAIRCPVLILNATRGGRPIGEREAELRRLGEHVDATARWYDTGHWISAEDVAGVAEAVTEFASQLE
ncbi:alpha/beta hydrolase [soil metagenome]